MTLSAVGSVTMAASASAAARFTPIEAFDTLIPPEFRGLDLKSEYELKMLLSQEKECLRLRTRELNV